MEIVKIKRIYVYEYTSGSEGRETLHCLEGTFGDVRRHFRLSPWGRGGIDIQWVDRALNLQNILQHTAQVPTAKDYPARNIISVEI